MTNKHDAYVLEKLTDAVCDSLAIYANGHGACASCLESLIISRLVDKKLASTMSDAELVKLLEFLMGKFGYAFDEVDNSDATVH